MTDYISRNSIGLTDFEIILCQADESKYKSALVMLLDKIEKLPAADVRPVVHGKWLKVRSHDGGVWKSIACSNCKYEPWFSSAEPLYNYCPNCGAGMRPEPPKEETHE